MTARPRRFWPALVLAALGTPSVSAQPSLLTQRGFVETSGRVFPQQAPNDPARTVGDLLAREEVVVKPMPWIQFAAGVDVRANSHDQVDTAWRVDVSDRGVTRPRISVRRLVATITKGAITIDAGKQFIRWGKADIVNPTDRFAPRDVLNVVDGEFLAVTGVRAVVQAKNETFEVAWVPRLTPSRIPLLDERWTAVPVDAASIPLVDVATPLPQGAQTGLRWGHMGAGYEYSVSFFDGFNHLPNIDIAPTFNASSAVSALIVRRSYPSIRTYGADAAVPTRWFTIKGEAAYFTSASTTTDEYVLYVVQLERQAGEWVIVAGYAGEVVTVQRAALAFSPDRGMTQSIVARASYTIDTTRSMALESAVRRNGQGMYAKAEYSQARGAHWRATIAGVVIAGHASDFLGQYRRNSHATATLRYSF